MKSCFIFFNGNGKIISKHSIIINIGRLLKQYLFQCKSLQYRVFIMANNMQWIKSIHLKMYVSNINNHDRYIKRMRKTINDLSMWLVYVIGFTSIKFVALSIRSFSMVYWLGVATFYDLPSQYSWYKSTRNFKITCVLSDKYYVKWCIKRFFLFIESLDRSRRAFITLNVFENGLYTPQSFRTFDILLLMGCNPSLLTKVQITHSLPYCFQASRWKQC